jgi:hypothetical protein
MYALFKQALPEERRTLLLRLLGVAVGFGAGFLSGKECMTGYYTDKPRYIYQRIAYIGLYEKSNLK